MALISKTIVFLILAIIVVAYHGYQLQPCSLSTVSSFAASHLSRLGPIRSIRLYSAIGGESISADTVVARCTKKIVDSLNPKECSVTSTDDDPNGSHIQIVCVADAFEGKTSLQRQRLVYKAIWDEMSGPVHAVDSIIAKTPTEMGISIEDHWKQLSGHESSSVTDSSS